VERLQNPLRDFKKREEERIIEKLEKEQQELDQCTFHPEINRYSSTQY